MKRSVGWITIGMLSAALIVAGVLIGVAIGVGPRRGETVLRTGGRGQLELTSERLQELIEQKKPDFYLIDVRSEGEFLSGAIPGAINIPYTQVGARPPTDDLDAYIVVYCLSGSRSGAAEQILENKGYTNVTNFGGVFNWTGKLVRP